MTPRIGDRVIYRGQRWWVKRLPARGVLEILDDDGHARIVHAASLDAVIVDVERPSARPSHQQAPLLGGTND